MYVIVCLPNHDDGEIEQIPGTPQIGCCVLPEAVGYDFHDTLGSKNY